MSDGMSSGLDFDELFTDEPAPAVSRVTQGCVFLDPPTEEPPAEGPIIGIDLGTTNSCVAVYRDGDAEIVRSPEGYHTVPSIVALSSKGKLLVGHRAKTQMLTNPGQTIYGAKRLVGRPFASPTVDTVKGQFLYPICPGESGRAAVRLGEHVLSLEEVQGIILRECKEMAETALDRPIHRAVVTVPAYYSEQQRSAVRDAGRLAGLRVERILNEPTAAALAYGLGKNLDRKVLIYDLGGGTFDATALRVHGETFEVLATGGDTFLGGADFDDQLVKGLLRRFEGIHGRQFMGDLIALSRIVDAAERAKVALSQATSTQVHLAFLMVDEHGVSYDIDCPVERMELELLCEDLVDRTIEVVQQVLHDASLTPEGIDDIIIVGGQSRMPLVRGKLRELFGKDAHAGAHADEAIALGAALYGGSVVQGQDVLLIDVVPMSLGIGMPGGAFKPIIPRNTKLPVEKTFTVIAPKSVGKAIEISVFQGNAPNIAGNDYVGTLRLEGDRPTRTQLLISLRLDTDCVLEASAQDLATRRQVTANFGTLYSEEQLEERLKVRGTDAEAAQAERKAELEERQGALGGLLRRVLRR